MPGQQETSTEVAEVQQGRCDWNSQITRSHRSAAYPTSTVAADLNLLEPEVPETISRMDDPQPESNAFRVTSWSKSLSLLGTKTPDSKLSFLVYLYAIEMDLRSSSFLW